MQRVLERPGIEPSVAVRAAAREAGLEIRFVCTNAAHQGRRMGDEHRGIVVAHSGTFGFCPCGSAPGPHAWSPLSEEH